MKEFNLEKALAGEPVMLRNGCKGFIKFQKPKCYKFSRGSALGGYWINNKGIAITESWKIDGTHYDNIDININIVGMYEPRPTVTLTLPCPIKTAHHNQEVFKKGSTSIITFRFDIQNKKHNKMLESGTLFYSEKDVQAWLDEMKNARR